MTVKVIPMKGLDAILKTLVSRLLGIITASLWGQGGWKQLDSDSVVLKTQPWRGSLSPWMKKKYWNCHCNRLLEKISTHNRWSNRGKENVHNIQLQTWIQGDGEQHEAHIMKKKIIKNYRKKASREELVMHHITMFQSTNACIYNCGPISL